MDFNIRKAVEIDKDFIVYANKEIDEESYIEKSILKENIEKDLFQNERCVCLIVDAGEKRAGMALFSKVYWADRGEGVYISQIYVQPEFRKQGVMKRLLKAIFEYFPETHFVTCLVSRKNEKMLCCMNKMGFDDENMASFAINREDFPF